MSEQDHLITCYLCKKEDTLERLMTVPLTTGGHVYSHIGCLKIYMKTATQASACNSCSGDAGCC